LQCWSRERRGWSAIADHDGIRAGVSGWLILTHMRRSPTTTE
jgi:hypothetical protein